MAGDPVPGLTVTVQAMVLDPAIGATTTPPVVGTATTARDGTWALRLPLVLPPAVQQAADANNGVLNLWASASGVGRGQAFSGMQALYVAVGTATEAGRDVPQDIREADSGPAPQALVVTPVDGSDTVSPSSSPASPSAPLPDSAVDTVASQAMGTTTALSGSSVDVVDGVDYSGVVPMDNWCKAWSWTTTDTSYHFTNVAQEHAYWDAKGWDEYHSKASTAIGAALSVNGTVWSLAGSDMETNSNGASVSAAHQGAHQARWFKIEFRYHKKYGTQHCENGTYHKWSITSAGWHAHGGDPTYKYGGHIYGEDGKDAFQASPTSYRNWVKPGSSIGVTSGKTMSFSGAVTAFGVGLTAQTSYNADHEQHLSAGSGAVRKHWTWGKNGPFTDHPGVIYSW